MHPLLIAWVVTQATDPVPATKNVTAGWTAFAVFIGLVLAVVVLAFSLTRHLRKVRDNADKGVFGPPETPDPKR
jgi:TRAP-type C4-dicarboxylate transport system permease small subunit